MQELTVTLTADKDCFQLGEAIRIRFSVENSSAEAVSFCRYMTPFEGFCGDILNVRDASGNGLAYHGILKKRGAPVQSDFIHLAAGAVQNCDFDLGNAYPITAPGTYQLCFVGRSSMNGLPDSNGLQFAVTG